MRNQHFEWFYGVTAV